jgi:antitoxin YefM
MDDWVQLSIKQHQPLIIKRKNKKAFVVISEEDYSSMQETLYVLNNPSLMRQINASMSTYKRHKIIRSHNDFERNRQKDHIREI